jgi:hypothetical protein
MRAEVSEAADPHHDTFVCVTFVTKGERLTPDLRAFQLFNLRLA